jgi:sec-independent protein translocase protein TatA
MPQLGPGELVLVFLILVLLFGASRLRDLGGAMGGAIREFRSAVSGADEEKDEEKAEKEEQKA